MESTTLMEHAWVLPAIMAGSFLVILFFGKRFPEKVRAGFGILAVGICFVLSIGIAAGWMHRTDNPLPADQAASAARECGMSEEKVAELEEEAGAHGGEAKPEGTGEGTTSEGDGHSTGGEDKPASEAPAHQETGFAPGEQAAGAVPAAGTAEGGEAGKEEHSTVPVCTSTTWFQSGGIKFELGFLVDGLAAMMLITVTLISLLVHIYSIEYLHGDRRFTHYYAFLSLFTASMLFYVLSNNTLQMLTGWELVGLCSFGLIGHWWEDKKNSDAALKAFLTNRVGDMGLIVGVVVTFFAAGATSFNIFHINEYALSDGASKTLLLIGALCLFGGVTSKSGQFPLHTWLPDAMAGPTPVSALIHAATMVVAGVYLIARMYAVFYNGLHIGTTNINYVAFIGGFTAVMGALLAFVQVDLKKVLAYSTISQLGYMVMALGVGAWTAGIFHLFTHAMFKACLFLGAGSVSHACHHTFDMREMGGLRKKMPVTHATFFVAMLALIALPPFAGFWSKDEILAGAYLGQNGGSYTVMLGMGLLTAFCTAAYMTRAYWLTFLGEYRGHAHPHESPKVITIPLVILSFLAAFIGFVNMPKFAFLPGTTTLRFEHYVEPTFLFPKVVHPEFTPIIAAASVVLAVIGMVVAWQYYAAKSPVKGLTERSGLFAGLYNFLANKYYLDRFYEQGVRDTVKGPIAAASYWFNQNVLDAVVNGVGKVSVVAGRGTYKVLDQAAIDGLVNGAGAASEGGGQLLRRIQTGKVQQYGALLFGSAVVLAIVLVIIT